MICIIYLLLTFTNAFEMDHRVPSSDGNFQVRPSTVSGLGLFAVKILKKNEFISEYKGNNLTLLEIWFLKNRDYLAKGYGINHYIDAKNSWNCWGRYINDYKDPEKINSKFIRINDKLFIYSTKVIESGEEIFISYGKIYWIDKDKLDVNYLNEIKEFYLNDFSCHKLENHFRNNFRKYFYDNKNYNNFLKLKFQEILNKIYNPFWIFFKELSEHHALMKTYCFDIDLLVCFKIG